jgi:hypothetical protein
MKFFKQQSIHERKIGDKSLILTADGNVELELGNTKNVDVTGNLRVTGDTTGPKVTNVYYVTEDGSDLNDGRSAGPDGALASIKKAAEIAPEGSTIIVAPGDYYEENPITLKDFVTVTGQGELRNTRIFPRNNQQTIFYMGNGCYLYQLTFRGLRAPGWCAEIRPGTLCTTSPYVQNCTNMNGPWLNDGTEFIPFETVQIEGIEPSARPLMVEDYPELPLAKQVNDTGGGGGILVDGDQYNPASLVFSFVADAFTQIAQGGIGFHITNFGYTQIVSCFTVFCSTGFLTTKGGYLSISNSVSDFGLNGCIADGFYPVAYTNAVPDTDYYSSVGSVTIVSPGIGYTSAPAVQFEAPTGAGGVTATGTAQIDLTTGLLAAVTVDNAGSGYESVPQISFSGGDATIQAEARVNLSTNGEIVISSLRDKPQTGSIIQFQGDNNYYYITSSEITDPPFVYDETICRRDVRRIVDAVAGDIVLGTNYQSITAAKSYLRSTSSKVILDQLEPTIYGLESARDEMKAQTTNLAMREEIDQRFNIITSVLSAGDSAGVPDIIYNDLSSITENKINAKDNVLVNRDFIIEELTSYINDQFTELSYNQTQFRTDMTTLINGVAYYAALGSDQQVIRQAQEFDVRTRFLDMMSSSVRYLQSRILALSEVTASAVSLAAVNEGFSQFLNILEDGDSAGITIEFPEHVGVESNRADTKDHLIANKAWLQAEFVAFISDDNPLLSFDVNEYKTDIGYIIDALTFDMLYGGNSSVVQEAIYYFNNKNSFRNFLDTEKQTIVDAFARLRFCLQRIIRGLVITPTVGGSYPNTESQDFSSGNATSVEASEIDALVQIIEDVVDNASLSDLPTKTYPVITTEPALQVAAANTIISQRDTFIEDAVDFNLSTNPTLTYDVDKCARDVGYIIDAIYRDAQLSTNHNSITAALAYKRASTAYFNVEQKPATIIAMREAKRLLVEAANRNTIFQQTVSDLFDDILNIIEFDQLPSEGTVYPEPGPASGDLINATDQLIANRTFLQEEVIAYINDNNFVYDQAKCERDTGILIDAAYYDAAFGTNYNAVTSGLAYQRANSAYVLSDQNVETIGAITFAKGESETATASDATAQGRVTAAFNEILDIIQNGVVSTDTAADALVFPAPTGASAALQNAALQLQNNRQFLAQEAIAYIQNNYQNFIYDQEKCERDVGLIMDAVALDIALGTNYNSVTAGLAYQRASSADLQDNQKIQTLAALRELKKQLVLLGLSDTAETRSDAAMDEIIDILENGVISTDTAADALVFPAPTGGSADRVAAKDQLIANKAFIVAEITAWIALNYPSLVYDSTKCERDVGYIIDALCHDMLYGGNSASVQAARSYFVGATSQLGAGEEIATADAYRRLQDVVGDIVIEAPVVKTTGNALSQDTSGTPASSSEADEVEGLVSIIVQVIDAGNTSGLPSVTLPTITWAENDLEEAYNTIKGNKETVQENIIIFIANNFQTFDYDAAKCERDVGILVEAAAYDAVLGTNYNAVTAGLAYQRANSAYVLSDQNLQTIKAIEYVRDTVSSLTISSATRSATNAAFNEVLDIIQNGVVSTSTSADALTFTDPGVDVNHNYAKNELQANKNFLKAEIVAYLATNYPGLVYNQTKCERDIEYILDALSYDILYGGNLATKQAAESYFVGAVSQLGSGQQAATRDAFIELKAILGDVVQNITYGTPNQSPVVVPQETTGPGADAGTAGEVQDKIQIIIDVIAAGSTSGMPADQTPDITWANATAQTDFATIINAESAIQDLTINYIDTTFTRTFTFNTAKCERDTKYIVDALTYDLLYGGNSATYEAANAYWVGATTQVSGQQQETADSLGWISTIIESVITDTVYSDPEQAVVTQNTTAGPGTTTEAGIVQDLIEIIQNVITDGIDTLPTKTYPSISWAAAGIQTAIASLASAKDTIIDDTIEYIGTTYNGFNYDQEKCRRDTGYLIDAVAHDLLYEGNIATLIATRAYFLGAVQYIPPYQVANTVAAYEHLATIAEACIEGVAVSPTTGNTESQVLSGSYGTATESATTTGLFNITKNAINNGNLIGTPGEVEPNVNWLPEATRIAATAMLAEKANIQDAVIEYITDNIVGFDYNIEKCQRDTGYIVDAALYDMMYGGNKQTRRAAEAYYNGAILGAARVGNSDQTLITAYSYYALADIISSVAKNDPVTKSYGNTETQDIGIPDGDSTASDYLALLIDRIAKSIIDGNTDNWHEVNHNYDLGSPIYNIERENILSNLDTIEDNAIADLNATYGGTASVKLFPGIISVKNSQQANLYNVSTISTSGHAFEYVGAGITYNALPFFGGSAIPEQEIQEFNQGKVFAGGTVDQIGNFRVGNFFQVNALTGAITLNANQIDLSGLTSVGPFIRDNIPVGVELKEVSDNSNLIASTGIQDPFTAPTQKAVSIYVENRYLNKLTGGTVNGDLILNGDFDVNGAVISTDQTGPFSLLNTSATEINAFGAATTINLGAPTGTVTINPDLLVEGSLTVNGDIVFTGDVSLNIPDDTVQAYSITTNGSIDYVSINTREDEEKITFGDLPAILIQNTDESSSITTGALVVDGGVGIAKSLFVGIDLTVDGSVVLGDDRAIDTVDINGVTDIDVPDNNTSVFRVHENITDYIVVDTTDGAEIVEIGATPNLVVLNSDDATDATTGALQVTGGISTQRNVHAGVDITADRDIIADRDIEVNGTNIITDETGTFNVFNTNATTINAFGAATTINLGAQTGTLNLRNEQVIIDSVETLQIPVGTTLERPTAATGQIRFNTDTTVFEGYDGIAWGSLGGVKDVDQNTFIRPETSPGANNDELEFFTNDLRRAVISNTEFIIEDTNQVSINNTTNAGNYQTGALIVAGGVGIAKDLYVQGFIRGDNSGILQLTDLASDKIYIKADTIESPEQIKWIANSPDSAADDIVYPITLAHHSISGTPVAGSGTGLKFEMETSNDNFEIGGQIDVIAQDVTGTQEDFDMVFSTMISGTAAVEKLRLGENTSTFSTDVTINNDQLLTTQTTFNLLNDTATTINFAGAATALNIGATGGLTTIDQDVQVNEDVRIDGTLALTNIDLEVQYGGTGVSTFTADGILYGNDANQIQVTDAAGTSDTSESFQILTVIGGGDNTPVWTDTIDGGSF